MVDSAKGNIREGFAGLTGNDSEKAKGEWSNLTYVARTSGTVRLRPTS